MAPEAINIVNGLTYYIDASTFSDVINKRKDLTPLYIVASIVNMASVTPITLTITDARKYVNDIDSSLPLTLTSAESQGNFKKPEAIFNWIKYNNQFNGTAFIKGANVDNATINTVMYLDFENSVIIDGENDALLTMNAPVILGSNLTFKNLDIIFNDLIVMPEGVKNLIFDNCNITVNVPLTSPANNIIFSFIDSDNIVIKDSTLNVQYASMYDSLQVFRGSIFYLSSTINFKVINTVITANYIISAGVVTPGNIFTLVNSPICTIQDSVISGNFNKLLDNSNSNFVKLSNLLVTSTYNPNAGVTADSYDSVSYDTFNFVNSGQGYIYSNVNSILDSFIIDNVIFNYNPAVNSNDRYSFINFELSTTSSLLSNLNITNCKFNNLNVGGVKEDLRAAVSIINTVFPSPIISLRPTVLNAQISNNVCNRNQSIVLTSVTNSGLMLTPGLVAQNCQIVNNVCGAIGYWVSSETKVISMSPAVNIFNDKTSGLLINNNICHYIANFDHLGKYFLVSKISSDVSVEQCTYSSGKVIISGNTCNWIHTGIAYEENSSLHILNNILSAYDPNYIISYNHTLPNAIYNEAAASIAISPGYAIFVGANLYTDDNILTPPRGNDSACIISGNVTSTGYWTTTSFTTALYTYALGYIYCQSSCTITNNILKGVGETFGFGSLILVGGKSNIVTNNKIYRDNKSIFAYVTFANFEAPHPWDGADSIGIVVDNFFDSPFINNILPQTINTTRVIRLDVTSFFATNWILERNINQTITMSYNVSAGQHTWGSVHRVFPGTVPGGIDIWSQDDPAATIRVVYLGGSGLLDNYQWTIPV